MDKTILFFKGSIAGVGALLAELFGGADAALDLLLTLIICDVITGVLNAFIHKELNSTEMRNGFIHKVLIFVLLVVSVRADYAITEYFDKDFHIRLYVIVFFCLEETISILENVANAGVPIPMWLRTSLKKVSKEVSSTLPRYFADIIKSMFKIDITKQSSDKNSELKDDSPSSNQEEKSEGNSNTNQG